MYDRENVNPREIGGAKRSVSRSVHEFLRSNVSRSSTDRIFIARRVLRSSGFDGRPTMSRGRPRWGATFSIRKVERRDDENSEETGADPESTDPVCPSVVDFATRFPRSVLPFFRSFVLSFFRSFVLSFFRSFVLSFFRSFVLSFFRSFVLSFFRSSVLPFAANAARNSEKSPPPDYIFSHLFCPRR